MLLDLRTSSDYQHGHIPPALSFPFTLKPEKWLDALQDFHSPQWAPWQKRLSDFFHQHSGAADGVEAYCQTGTWKSAAFLRLAESVGVRVQVRPGGYRQYVVEREAFFQRAFPLVIVAGETGTGKTEVLQALAHVGEQVVDLEALAGHKGSAFGALGGAQTTTREQFQNDLMSVLQTLEDTRPIWLEDEAPALGQAGIPSALWKQMQSAPGFRLVRPRHERVARIMREYGQQEKNKLAGALQQLAPRLGASVVQHCQEALAQGELTHVVEALLAYYDPAYAHQVQARPQLVDLACAGEDAPALARRLQAAESASRA